MKMIMKKTILNFLNKVVHKKPNEIPMIKAGTVITRQKRKPSHKEHLMEKKELVREIKTGIIIKVTNEINKDLFNSF